MSLRAEFIALADRPDANVSELCRRFGISRKTGYKWLCRQGEVADRSRRPHHSPSRTEAGMEQLILGVRDANSDWSARKIKRRLEDLGHGGLPAWSTITAILRRHGRISPVASAASTPWQRFEHEHPNALWQMDFKGHFPTVIGPNCHPLTVLDDHSRYNVVLQACRGETRDEVQPHLIDAFRRYGLPVRISCDHGPPWGTARRDDRLTRLGAWLIRLGITITHARVRHPQTNGKNERFHRTLKSAVLRRVQQDHPEVQRAFDRFRHVYNHERPHDALGLALPISRFRPSPIAYPETLPPIDYPTGDVRKVDSCGHIYYRGKRYRISRALCHQPVAVLPVTTTDGQFDVIYCHQTVRRIDLRACESDE